MRLLGLFAFEFVVVVLGVLTAQAVQSWAQDSERAQEADRERFRLEQALIGAADTAKVWRAALPCLHQRIGKIMRTAAAGEPLAAGIARRPKLVQTGYEATTPDVLQRIAASSNDRYANALADAQVRVATIQAAGMDIRSQWEQLRLLDPEFGPASLIDRAAARAAGANILNHLRSIEFALDMIARL